jgi:hypothetical protein
MAQYTRYTNRKTVDNLKTVDSICIKLWRTSVFPVDNVDNPVKRMKKPPIAPM